MGRLPELRRFLRDPGHVDHYREVEVTWQHGASPTLLVYEGNELIAEVSLKDLSTEGIHQLLLSKGFKREPSSSSEL